MDQVRASTGKHKEKSDWQLFTNDGRFDSKLPPSQRLLRIKSAGYKVFVLPRAKSAAQKSATQKPATLKSEKAQPQVDNVENFVLVWLDPSMGKAKNTQETKNQLQQVINCVKIFRDPQECHTYMSSIKDEKIFAVISGTVEEAFVSSVHDEKQLESIYVYCPNKVKEDPWFSQYPEIRGIHTTILSLCEQLGKDVKKIDRTLLGFEIMEKSMSKNTDKVSQQDPMFMYDQLFRDIVLAVREENMQDIYEYCEMQYQGNSKELTLLRELKTTYASNSSIWWYSRESFVYRMLNKALRTHQYDILYLLRVFIRHLYEQIVEEQSKESINGKKLFRGQGMEKDDFERLRENKGGLLCCSSFLSTSADREVGLRFAREALGDSKRVSILMEITVEKNTVVPAANISHLSAYGTEKEWLFFMGSVFRIGSLKSSPEGIQIVSLTLTDDHDKQLTTLKEHLKKTMGDSNTCLNFGRLMQQLAHWKKSEYFYRKALETETSPQRRSVLYNSLAIVKQDMNQDDAALTYYHKSLELKETGESASVSDKAATYNNIGTLYHKQGKLDQAREYYQKVIEACNAQGNNNEELIATLNGNMAGILNGEGKHEEALERCQESLMIRLKILPELHPDLANAYGTIANTMFHLKMYAKAIEYAEKAVDIDRQALPTDHHQALLHKNNLAVYKRYQEQQQQQPD